MKELLISAIVVSLFLAGVSSAQATASSAVAPKTECKNTVPLKTFRGGGILYKPENVHGGRGATLIIQNFKYWYGSKVKKIYDAKCKKVIGKVSFWSLGYPYGERYYSKMGGGSRDNGSSLALKARRASRRSGGIIVINRRFSVSIKDFKVREGFVRGG